MEMPERLALTTNVVEAVVASVHTFWERIVVHYEVLETSGARVQNELTLIVQKDGAGKHSVVNFVLSDEAKVALLALRDDSATETGKPWNTCILIVDPPGTFNFDFSYDPPKIINGVLDEDYKKYSKYLPHFLAEKGLAE